MKNIVLTGFMGTGKSAVGKQLAKRLKMKLICLDDMIEAESGKSISDIFSQDGEPVFRDIESSVILRASKEQNVVIDAGGGAIIKEENLKNLKASGIIFSLKATPEEIYNRIKGSTHRPLLNKPEPLKEINELLAKRRDIYERADYSIETTGIEVKDVVENIINYMEQEKDED